MRRLITVLAVPAFLLAFPQSPGAQDVSRTPSAADPLSKRYNSDDWKDDPELDKLPGVGRHRAFLPVSVDLSDRMPRPGDQGDMGACAAWSIAYAARSYYTSSFEGRDLNDPKNLPSPSYVYSRARQVAGDKPCDPGATLSRIVDVLKQGALSLSDYPYNDNECALAPPPASVRAARDFRVRGMRRVDKDRIDDIKGQLARTNPVVISMKMSPAFHRIRGDATFDERLGPSDPGGRHGMTIVGYDDRKQAFRLINSWGQGWGDKGFAWVSYETIKSRLNNAIVLDVVGRPIAQRPPPAPVNPVRPGPKTVVVAPPRPTPTPVSPPRPQPTPAAQPAPLAPSVPAPPPAPVAQPAPMPGPAPIPAPAAPEGLTAGLAGLACARVNVNAQDGGWALSGFVASTEDFNLVQQLAVDTPNTTLGNVLIARWPQCEALQTLETPLQAAATPAVDIGPTSELQLGDLLRIQIQSPPQISYLYVSYIQADGSVVHLAQPRGLVPQPTLPNQTLVFGDGVAGRTKFVIGAPFGQEMIIALASRSPLFSQELPQQQSERDYLTMLRTALIYKPSPDMPDREVSAAIQILQTRGSAP